MTPTPMLAQTPSKRAKLSFNDSIEVYYYPENMEQHAHHFRYDSNELEESADDLVSDQEVQEDTDPDFEGMLLDYIKKKIIPSLNQKSSAKKRARRSLCSAPTMQNLNTMMLDYDECLEEGTNSDSSVTTNENTMATNNIGSSDISGIQSPRLRRRKAISFEPSSREDSDNEGVTSLLEEKKLNSASPILYKQT